MAPPDSHLLRLPAELRLRIFEYLIQVPPLSTTSAPHRAAAYIRGHTSGVGHCNVIQVGNEWRSISLGGPVGFSLLAPAITRLCKTIYYEAMDVLYKNILWVINIHSENAVDPDFRGINSKEHAAIVAGPERESMFLKHLQHVYVRQHILMEEDQVQKAHALGLLLACLNSERKSTEVAIHFGGSPVMDETGTRPWPFSTQNTWHLYRLEMARMNLGNKPQIRVNGCWRHLDDMARIRELAASIGGWVLLCW